MKSVSFYLELFQRYGVLKNVQLFWPILYMYTPTTGTVFPYSLPSVGPGRDPGVQAVSPQVT